MEDNKEGEDENGEDTKIFDSSKKEENVSLKRKTSPSDSDADECNVHVVARVRPLNEQEIEKNHSSSAQFPGDGAVWIENQGKTKSFSFHAAFQPGCSQEQVFHHSGMQKLLDMALEGYACTVFAYGQTGSGKTFTLTGPVTPEESNLAQEKSLRDLDSYGLIQYSFSHLMKKVTSQDDVTFTIKASYLEIYNEQVQDLLNPSSYDAAQIRWSKTHGFYVENLFVLEVETLDDLMNVLEDGMKNRAVAEHNMNEHSSRSHSVLTVYIDGESNSDDLIVTKHGKVSFVDLAGSEKVKDTGSKGETLIEATNINKSLLTLGNCISALSDTKRRGGHIPYRDSKLTKLLADSLGGSGVTLMIACVTPSDHHLPETLNTLRYAKRARKIKNKPVVKIDPREELILKLQREMKLLRQENHFLRKELEFPQREKPRFPHPSTADNQFHAASSNIAHPNLPFLPPIKSEEAKDFSPEQRPPSDNSLYEMLQEYMVENEALRNENRSLLSQHNLSEKEQRMMSRENDRLSRKLEDLSRLMMSSPPFGSSFLSRTNSGRSDLSFQTFASSVTSLSQQNMPLSKMLTRNNLNHQPIVAWHSSPVNRDLPPVKNRTVPGHDALQPQIKNQWKKSPSYASQFKRRLNWNRQVVRLADTSQTRDSDVMKDFPMRDYQSKRAEYFYHGNAPDNFQDRRSESHGSSAMRDTADALRYRPDFQARLGKSFHPAHNPLHAGGALPEDAYKPQEISPRTGMTKELSATSLRRLNDRMRQEMKELDEQIHSYQKSVNQVNKKIPAT